MMSRFVSNVKRLVVSSEREIRVIKTGAFQGLKMQLDLTYQTQLYLGLHERELYQWLKMFSMKIQTAIDIGAAEGEYTLYFLNKTSAQNILVFEPETFLQERLNNNIELNRIPKDKKLQAFSKFVSNSDDSKNCTLNSLSASITLPCLVKIDVDGGEVDVLQGADQLLDSPEVHWLVETHSLPLEETCLQIFKQKGYSTEVIPNAWWRMIVPEMRIGPLGTHNRWLLATKSLL